MATKPLREELLDLLRTGSVSLAPPCHSFANCCTCPKCQARLDENELVTYAAGVGLKLDRPTARRLLIKHPEMPKARLVVDGIVTAAKRKMAA